MKGLQSYYLGILAISTPRITTNPPLYILQLVWATRVLSSYSLIMGLPRKQATRMAGPLSWTPLSWDTQVVIILLEKGASAIERCKENVDATHFAVESSMPGPVVQAVLRKAFEERESPAIPLPVEHRILVVMGMDSD